MLVVGIVVVGWLVFAPPAYAPASETDLATRSNLAESRWQTKAARWIDENPLEYVAIVTVAVYTLTYHGPDDLGNESGPNKDTPVERYPETKGPNIKDTDVAQKWKEFLGEEPWENKNPRTGEYDPNRITSQDGKRSIRYGEHEWENPDRHHYHEEKWEYNSKKGVMYYINKAITIIKTRFRE